jgi:hypothetical protein
MLTIESRMVYKIWARTQTSFKYTSLWCPFLDPHPNHTSLKYRCLLKVSNRIRPTDRKHINSKHSPEYPPPRVRPETQGHESWWGHDTMTYPILTHRANLINLWGGCVLPAWIHLVVCKFTILWIHYLRCSFCEFGRAQDASTLSALWIIAAKFTWQPAPDLSVLSSQVSAVWNFNVHKAILCRKGFVLESILFFF